MIIIDENRILGFHYYLSGANEAWTDIGRDIIDDYTAGCPEMVYEGCEPVIKVGNVEDALIYLKNVEADKKDKDGWKRRMEYTVIPLDKEKEVGMQIREVMKEHGY